MRGRYLEAWLIIGIACVAFMALLLLEVRRREVPRQLSASLHCGIIGAFVYSAADLMTRLTVGDPQAHWAWLVTLYAGLMTIPPAWWLISLRYAEVLGEPPRFARSYWIYSPAYLAAFFFGVLVTNPWHHQFLTPRPLRSEFHALFWVHTGITYLTAVAAIGVQVWLAFRARRARVRENSRLLVLAMSAPLLANFVYMAAPSPGEVDPTIAAFTLASAVLVYLVSRRRVFSLSPVDFSEVRMQDPDGLLLLDPLGRLLDANPASRALFGALLDDEGDALLRVSKALDPTESSDDPRSIFLRLTEGIAPPGDAFRLCLANERVLRVTSLAIRDQRDEFAAILLRARDETALAEANARAAERASLLEAVLEAAGVGVAVLDRHARVRFENERMERIWGSPREETKGRRVHELVLREPLASREVGSQILELIEQASREPEGVLRRDFSLGDGRIIEAVSVPMREHGDITGRLFLNTDVTEQRRRERAALDAAKLDGLSNLAGEVAHGFNNLLTAVLGNAELAQLVAPPGSRSTEHLREVQHAAERGAEIANQLLAYAGRAPLREARVDITALLERMTRAIKAEFPQLAVEQRVAAPLPAVAGDAAQLERMFAELLHNAAEALEGASGVITVEALAEAGGVRLRVRDSGPGMSEETLSRAFDPFFSTKPKARGLGLAAARGIVMQHGGTIEAQSELGHGTTLSVRLRAAAESAASAIATASSEEDPWRGTGRILIVDDETSTLNIAQRLVESLGFEVVAVDRPSAALEAWRAAGGDFRAALIDATMPECSGPELLNRLRLEAPRLPAVIYSGFTRESFELPANPPTEFLHKPFRRSALAEVLRRVLEEAR